MGKWIKVSGEPVQVRLPRRDNWVCAMDVTHYGVEGECQCEPLSDIEDEPHDGRDPRGFVKVTHTGRRRPVRSADNRNHPVIMSERKDAVKNGFAVRPKHRKKAPAPGAAMWKMDNAQRARAGSRMRSL